MAPSLQDRFRGCLMGLALGDALGGRFEAQSADFLRSRFPDVPALIAQTEGDLWYTDDTQMAIGVAETLISCGRIDEAVLCQSFASNYTPSRGYGRGARAVMEAMAEGRDYRAIAAEYFTGGSFGNGAAMRVAPVGLLFRNDTPTLLHEARVSSLPTHVHPLGIEGAQLIALAVGYACATSEFNRADYMAVLIERCESSDFRDKLTAASQVSSCEGLAALGNGIAAIDSVPTAIAAVALTPGSYVETIGNVILLGGDTDTIAAMAGAISGALLGIGAIPAALVDKLEDSPKGRRYLLELADKLLAAEMK